MSEIKRRNRLGDERAANRRNQRELRLFRYQKDVRDWMDAAVTADIKLEIDPPPEQLRHTRWMTEGDLLELSSRGARR
jgi:hypothetical protein